MAKLPDPMNNKTKSSYAASLLSEFIRRGREISLLWGFGVFCFSEALIYKTPQYCCISISDALNSSIPLEELARAGAALPLAGDCSIIRPKLFSMESLFAQEGSGGGSVPRWRRTCPRAWG